MSRRRHRFPGQCPGTSRFCCEGEGRREGQSRADGEMHTLSTLSFRKTPCFTPLIPHNHPLHTSLHTPRVHCSHTSPHSAHHNPHSAPSPLIGAALPSCRRSVLREDVSQCVVQPVHLDLRECVPHHETHNGVGVLARVSNIALEQCKELLLLVQPAQNLLERGPPYGDAAPRKTLHTDTYPLSSRAPCF